MLTGRNFLFFGFVFIVAFINPFLVQFLGKFLNLNFYLLWVFLNLLISSVYFIFYSILERKERKKIVDQFKVIVEGDYRQRVDISEDNNFYFMVEMLNQFLKSIKGLFKEMIESSVLTAEKSDSLRRDVGKVFQMTDEIGEAMKNVASGAEAQSVNLDETDLAFQSLLNFIDKTHQNTENVASISQQATEVAEKSDRLVADFISETRENNQMILEIMEDIDSLIDSSKEASGIVQIITGIAKQTNLLALNASIEAARAGKEGKSFGVVATEIRDLSLEVDDSAKKISEILVKVNEQIQSIYQKINSNGEIIKEQKEKTVEVYQNISSLKEIVSNTYKMMNDLKEDTDQISHIVSKTKNSLETVLSISEQTEVNSQNVNASTKNQYQFLGGIEELAEKLNNNAFDLQELLASKVMDRALLNLCKEIETVRREKGLTKEILLDVKRETGIDDIYITNKEGVFTLSTIDSILGENLFELNQWAHQFTKDPPPVSVVTPIHRRIEDKQLFKFAMILTEDREEIIEVGLSLDSMFN